MPITKVEAPDGSIIKIEHPEGASQADIIKNASLLYGRQQQAIADRQRRLKVIEQGLDRTGEGPEGTFTENLFAGAGKAFVDLGRGARQLAVEGANLIPGVNLDEKQQELRDSATENRRLDAPLLKTGGGLLGNIGTNVGLALLPGGLASGRRS